jgi:hypothetical protein
MITPIAIAPVRSSQIEDMIQGFIGTSDVSNPFRANNYTKVRAAAFVLNQNQRVGSPQAGTDAEAAFAKFNSPLSGKR